MGVTDLQTYQSRWAYQKYWVMAHSQQNYNALRLLFKGNDWSEGKAERFDQLIAETEKLAPTIKTLRTAYQHVWGYFKKRASPEERETYKFLMEALAYKHKEMQDFLEGMTQKYQEPYLLGSRLMAEGL